MLHHKPKGWQCSSKVLQVDCEDCHSVKTVDGSMLLDTLISVVLLSVMMLGLATAMQKVSDARTASKYNVELTLRNASIIAELKEELANNGSLNSTYPRSKFSTPRVSSSVSIEEHLTDDYALYSIDIQSKMIGFAAKLQSRVYLSDALYRTIGGG